MSGRKSKLKRKRARQKARHRGDTPRFPVEKFFNAKGVLANVIQSYSVELSRSKYYEGLLAEVAIEKP